MHGRRLSRPRIVEVAIAPMSKRKSNQRWRIIRIRGNLAELVGMVAAADEKAAIKVAIKDYLITNPEQQRRLAARLDE
jgi:hypothetical protein